MAEKEHGVESVLWTNIGHGWIIQCVCGFGTNADRLMEEAGRQFDGHLKTEGPAQK